MPDSHILVLTAAPGGLSRRHVEQVQSARAERKGRWLAHGEAWESVVKTSDPLALRDEMRAAFAGDAIDVNVVRTEGRRKRLLVADLESTVIQNEMLDELAARVGAGDRVRSITRRAMNGELDFHAALRERVALLEGMTEETLEAAAAGIVLDTGASSLVAALRVRGVHTALVSGGFLRFASAVARRLGFDEHHANRLEVGSDGRLTGKVIPPVLDREAKRRILEALCRRLELGPDAVVAVGDGANDLAMLSAAGLGVAYRAKPAVSAQASVEIRHADLRGLLFLQGYGDDQI